MRLVPLHLELVQSCWTLTTQIALCGMVRFWGWGEDWRVTFGSSIMTLFCVLCSWGRSSLGCHSHENSICWSVRYKTCQSPFRSTSISSRQPIRYLWLKLVSMQAGINVNLPDFQDDNKIWWNCSYVNHRVMIQLGQQACPLLRPLRLDPELTWFEVDIQLLQALQSVEQQRYCHAKHIPGTLGISWGSPISFRAGLFSCINARTLSPAWTHLFITLSNQKPPVAICLIKSCLVLPQLG